MIVRQKQKKGGFIDISSVTATANNITYLCSDCNDELILESTYQQKNPFSKGKGYFCGSCQKTYDDSLVKLVKKPKAVASTIGDKNYMVFQTVPEDKGLDPMGDEYAKYDAIIEPSADQYLINSGATIINSRIEITDLEGRHRTLVRSKIM